MSVYSCSYDFSLFSIIFWIELINCVTPCLNLLKENETSLGLLQVHKFNRFLLTSLK